MNLDSVTKIKALHKHVSTLEKKAATETETDKVIVLMNQLPRREEAVVMPLVYLYPVTLLLLLMKGWGKTTWRAQP